MPRTSCCTERALTERGMPRRINDILRFGKPLHLFLEFLFTTARLALPSMNYYEEKRRKKQLIPTLNQRPQYRTMVTACGASIKTKTPSDSAETGKNEKTKSNTRTLQRKKGGPNRHKTSLDFFRFAIR